MQLPATRRQGRVVVRRTTSLHEPDQPIAQPLPIADFLTKPLPRATMNELLLRYFASASA